MLEVEDWEETKRAEMNEKAELDKRLSQAEEEL